MKKVFCAILVLLLVFSLAGCTGEKPEEVVERVTQAIKEGNLEKVKDNIDLDALEKLFPSEDSTPGETDETSSAAADFSLDSTLEKITVKILSSEKDGDNATVKAECTGVDLTEFMKAYMQKSMELALDFSKDEATKDEELNQFISDYLAREDLPMKTTTVDIKLAKMDKTWKITSTTEYLDALTGGYLSTAKSLADSFAG